MTSLRALFVTTREVDRKRVAEIFALQGYRLEILYAKDQQTL